MELTRGRVVKPLADAQQFLEQLLQAQSPNSPDAISDANLQLDLLDAMHHTANAEHRRWAEICLRCFISQQVDLVCRSLARQFGNATGLTLTDLLWLVLVDNEMSGLLHPDRPHPVQESAQKPDKFTSLATEILHSFDPKKAQLSTWCQQKVKSHPGLSDLLKQTGIYQQSAWSILNHTRPEGLPRILQTTKLQMTSIEDEISIEQAIAILQSYHAIYRRDRLSRSSPQRGRCLPPSPSQLEQMRDGLQQQGWNCPTETILTALKAIAQAVRNHRRPPVDSLDAEDERGTPLMAIPAPTADPLVQAMDDEQEVAMQQFLQQYRQEARQATHRAIAQVVGDRVAHHQRRKQPRHREFLKALHLFYCEGMTMGNIAPLVNLEKQYQVTRLLEREAFQADVRRQIIEQLSDRIGSLAKNYVDPERLQRIDQVLQQELAATVDDIDFTVSLCQHLNTNQEFQEQSQ